LFLSRENFENKIFQSTESLVKILKTKYFNRKQNISIDFQSRENFDFQSRENFDFQSRENFDIFTLAYPASRFKKKLIQ